MKCPLTSLVIPTDMLQEHYTCHAKAWSDRINQTIKKQMKHPCSTLNTQGIIIWMFHMAIEKPACRQGRK